MCVGTIQSRLSEEKNPMRQSVTRISRRAFGIIDYHLLIYKSINRSSDHRKYVFFKGTVACISIQPRRKRTTLLENNLGEQALLGLIALHDLFAQLRVVCLGPRSMVSGYHSLMCPHRYPCDLPWRHSVNLRRSRINSNHIVKWVLRTIKILQRPLRNK